MQAGFALVEAGFTRAKNTTNILFKNLMDFVIGTIAFWFIGFGIMFGSKNGFWGGIDLFTQHTYRTDMPDFAFLIFQTVFAATAATIVSGAMAERTKFNAYLYVQCSNLTCNLSNIRSLGMGRWLVKPVVNTFS